MIRATVLSLLLLAAAAGDQIRIDHREGTTVGLAIGKVADGGALSTVPCMSRAPNWPLAAAIGFTIGLFARLAFAA